MRRALGVACVALGMLGAPVARAEDSASRGSRWYGTGIVIADSIYFVVAGTGAAISGSQSHDCNSEGLCGSETIAFLGYFGWTLTSPILHLANGEPLHALGSLGLRLTPLLAAAAIGSAACSDSGCPGVTLGVLGATAAAVSVVDAAVIAYHPAPETSGAAIAPSFATVRGGGVARIAGSF